MKVTVHSREPVFPMPVLVVSTFNEDGTVNAMTAAWGGAAGSFVNCATDADAAINDTCVAITTAAWVAVTLVTPPTDAAKRAAAAMDDFLNFMAFSPRSFRVTGR